MEFKGAVLQSVKERGAWALSGYVIIPGERSRGEPLVVKVEGNDPLVWAELAVHSKPPIVWLREEEIDLDADAWMVPHNEEDWIPSDIQEKMEQLPASQRRKIEALRKELRSICSPGRVATMTAAVILEGVVYESTYHAEWTAEAMACVSNIDDILDTAPTVDLTKKRQAEEKALMEQIELALLADPDFINCTTKSQRYSFARDAANAFEDHPAFGVIYSRLSDVAEKVFVKAKGKAKR